MGKEQHTLLVLPGFVTPARHRFHSDAVELWKQYDINAKVHLVRWKKGNFITELDTLDTLVTRELEQENKVSLLGTSAGGAMVLDLFMEHPEIHRVVTVSSRLKSKAYKGYEDLSDVAERSPAAAESIRWLEENDVSLTTEMRKRVMNTRVLSGDDRIVPALSFLPGAENIWLPPAYDHVDAVSKTLTEHSGVIVDFIKS